MASYNLEEGAQMWYIQVQQDEGTPSWRRFTDLLNLRYGPPLRSAPLFELADCRRTSTVAAHGRQERDQWLGDILGLEIRIVCFQVCWPVGHYIFLYAEQ